MNYNRTEEARKNRLAAMVGDDAEPVPAPKAADPYDGRKQLREACAIRLDRIIPDPDQPRTEFEPEALARLAESLKARGQLQPVRVRWDEGRGAYVVIVGERRLRAARAAGLESLVCVVASGEPTAADLLEDQLVENALREDLRPVEQAKAFRRLMAELNLTQQMLAARLRISQTTVSQSLSLLDLAEGVQARVDAGELAPSAAYQLAKVEGHERQEALASRVVAEGLTRTETVEAVRKASGKAKDRGRGKTKKATSRVFRHGPVKVTVECGRGLAYGAVRDALAAAVSEWDGAADAESRQVA